jgi:drug/metabolite transporter (DMT)-like permease
MPILTRLVYQADSNMPPLVLVTWRFIVASLVLGCLVGLSGQGPNLLRVKRVTVARLSLVGGFGTLTAFTAAVSLERVPVSTHTLLVYSFPAIVAIINRFLGETLGQQRAVAIGLALLGCSLTISGPVDVENPLDLLLPLLNAFFYSLYLILAARYARENGLLAASISTTATLTVLLLATPFFGFSSPQTLDSWWPLVSLGIISTALPIFWMFKGLSYLGASHAAILSTVEPILVIGLAILFLNERINFLEGLGGVFILLSLLLLNLPAAYWSRWFGRAAESDFSYAP